ncbi:MAG: ROK family protein [bacterium]|nr:ROK family protein [bacterium]
MYLLCDIGGSKTRVGATKDCRLLVGEPIVFENTNDVTKDMARFAEAAREAAGGETVEGLAGGIAGVLDAEHARLVFSPNKPADVWVGAPIRDLLSKAINGAPVHLENDTAMIGLGEAHFGAGRGAGIIAYMTVSTGIGGSRIVDGAIDAARFGFEPGRQIIDLDGSACPLCGSDAERPLGELEAYASGGGLKRRFGKSPYLVEEEHVWDEVAYWLAVGLNNTIVLWSPDVIVLGGSMINGTKGPVISLEAIEKHLKKVNRAFPELPILKKAELGDFGGLYGAMAYINQKHLSSRA